MSVKNVPTLVAAGGGIKLVQRGQAVSAGNITITAVGVTKTFVRSFSEGADGTMAISGSTTGTLNPSGGATTNTGGSDTTNGSFPTYDGTRTMSGGTMDATTKSFGAYLSDSTTLVATGACRWDVVEFA